MAARHRGDIAVVVTHLGTGETASLNAERRFRSASLYKLFILHTAFQQIAAGALARDEVLTLTPALAQANPYADLPTGARTSVDCALRTMIEMSGNAVADMLEARLGLPAINAHIRAMGLQHSEVTASSAHISAADAARLLAPIARGEAVSASASAQMLDLLFAQQHVDLMPTALPLGVRVANKTGQLPGLRHDAGIVYAPSGTTYLFVALVENAPTDAAARAAIHDLSRTAYAAFEPGGITLYRGLPPRLAREIFRLPDDQGRLRLLADPRTETVPLGQTRVNVVGVAADHRIRPEALPDLLAVQEAAAAAGLPFWVSGAYRRPADADAVHTLPPAWHAPCHIEFPDAPVTQRPPIAAPSMPAAPPRARQHWLGITVFMTDSPDGAASQTAEAASPTARWLLAHGWEHGFVPALPESPAGETLGYEPWTLRWVGREMAAHLRPLIEGDARSYGMRATAELERAQRELAAQGPDPNTAGLHAAALQTPGCWTNPAASTRGCPARWYFLPLP